MIAGLLSLTDGERRKLTKAVAKAWRKAHPDRWTRHDWRLDLALAGVCSWIDAKRLRLRNAYFPSRSSELSEGLFAVLGGRRPEWLERWVERELDNEESSSAWPFLRRLVRSGACPKPATDGYIEQMVRCRAGARGDERPLTTVLRQDPELLADEVWRVFEVDPQNGNLFLHDEADWNRWRGPISWGAAFVELAASGGLDRFRLLSSSL